MNVKQSEHMPIQYNTYIKLTIVKVNSNNIFIDLEEKFQRIQIKWIKFKQFQLNVIICLSLKLTFTYQQTIKKYFSDYLNKVSS